jgi:hypothetical protein
LQNGKMEFKQPVSNSNKPNALGIKFHLYSM